MIPSSLAFMQGDRRVPVFLGLAGFHTAILRDSENHSVPGKPGPSVTYLPALPRSEVFAAYISILCLKCSYPVVGL